MVGKKRPNKQQNELREVPAKQGADYLLELDGIAAPKPSGYSFGATQTGSARQSGKAGPKPKPADGS